MTLRTGMQATPTTGIRQRLSDVMNVGSIEGNGCPRRAISVAKLSDVMNVGSIEGGSASRS